MKRMSSNLVLLIVVILLVIVGYKGLQHFRSQSNQPSAIQMANKPTPTPKVVVIRSYNLVVKDNKLVSGPTTLTANQGDKLEITITADVDGELHLHGYNIPLEFKKNQPSTLSANLTISGRFPYELEDTKTEIGALEVQPK